MGLFCPYPSFEHDKNILAKMVKIVDDMVDNLFGEAEMTIFDKSYLGRPKWLAEVVSRNG